MTRIGKVLLLTAATSVLAAESPRPRGVSPEFAKFYKDKDTFTCISHPNIKIPFPRVNDDYCDCPDGSDEPGTSACTFLMVYPSLWLHQVAGLDNVSGPQAFALPGFYCKNKGHRPEYLSFSYVNDGVCDYEICCDGSDEWQGAGGVKCEDRCKEIGKEWRKLDEERQKSLRTALKKKDELLSEAKKARDDIAEELKTLGNEIVAQEQKAKELKEKFEEVKRRERGKVVGSTGGKASRTTVLAGLAKQRVEELRNALTNTIATRNALKQRVAELEGILATFKEEYNPNFNDEGVKRAVKAWEDYAANKDDTDNSAVERDYDEIAKPDTEQEGINWVEWETEEESDVEAIYAFEEYLPKSVRAWIQDKLYDLRNILVENGLLADNSKASGSESKAVTDARTDWETADQDVKNKENRVRELKDDLEKDYGPDGIFRALKGKCVSKDQGEYTYELCWMDRTTQKSKKGGGNTGMGSFTRFDWMFVEEDVTADGKGLGTGDRIVLMFENGQHCWNGPNRQTTVVLGCAEEDEIWKVVEQEKCLYRMDVGTPAVCEKRPPAAPQGGAAKDEL
ncbi:protein kinase-like protein C substrate [Xylogone sp. PMI_703]|nr:protein kinase-like protein C substrate [Xylogone sp. PMI_703]